LGVAGGAALFRYLAHDSRRGGLDEYAVQRGTITINVGGLGADTEVMLALSAVSSGGGCSDTDRGGARVSSGHVVCQNGKFHIFFITVTLLIASSEEMKVSAAHRFI
jgi:hypothetical protein